MTRNFKYPKNQGFALILVLWMVALLTIMAASFAQNMRRETLLISNIRDNAQAQAYAEAGTVVAQLMVTNKDETLRWRTDGSLYQLTYADARIRVKIFAETGKIDINKADESTLLSVFEREVIDPDQLTGLVNAILDWRDKDEDVRIDGAEKEQYQDQGLDYQPRNKPFQTLEELQLVLGFNTQLYNSVETLLTVYSGSKDINPANASREVLLTIPEATPELVDIYLLERLENTRNGIATPEFPLQIEQSSSAGTVFTIVSEALLPTGVKGRLRVVVKESSNAQAFSILDWEQRFVGGESFFQEQMDQLIVN